MKVKNHSFGQISLIKIFILTIKHTAIGYNTDQIPVMLHFYFFKKCAIIINIIFIKQFAQFI